MSIFTVIDNKKNVKSYKRWNYLHYRSSLIKIQYILFCLPGIIHGSNTFTV